MYGLQCHGQADRCRQQRNARDASDSEQVGSDFVLGVWRDELDVEHVRLYELAKP